MNINDSTIPPGKVCIGTCSICAGPVCVHQVWMATIPDTPTCARCGAIKVNSHGPVIPMQPGPTWTSDAISTGGPTQ